MGWRHLKMSMKKFIITITIVGILLFSAVGAGTILLNNNIKTENIDSIQEMLQRSDESDESNPSPLSSNTITLIDEGFEGDFFPPEDWSTNGWNYSLYGSPCEGLEHAFSWAIGDELTTPTVTFEDETVISFQKKAESSSHPMDLEVWLDYGNPEEELIWSAYDYTNRECEMETITLDGSYAGEHTITWLGLTEDFKGQILDDILVETIEEDDDFPSIEVEKTVRVVGTTEWSDSVFVQTGDVVEFNVCIHNPYENYWIHWSGDIKDTFPCNLKYVNGSMNDFPLHEKHNEEEVVDWQNKTVLWHPANDQNVSPGGYLNFTYLANVTCDCMSNTGHNYVVVSPDQLINHNDPIDIINNSDRGLPNGIPLNVTDSATVICLDDDLGIDVSKKVTNDSQSDFTSSHDVWFDSFAKFKIVVENTGSVVLNDVLVKDTLPDVLSFNADYYGSSYETDYAHTDVSGQDVYWNLTDIDLDVGDSFVLYFTADVVDGSYICGDDYVNNVVVTGEDGCCDEVSDSDWAEVIIICPDNDLGIDVSKKVTNDSQSDFTSSHDVWFDSFAKFKIVVENTGSVVLNDVLVKDTLPDVLSFNADYYGSSYETDYAHTDVSGQDVYWNLTDIDLDVGDSFVLYFTADVVDGSYICGDDYVNNVVVTGEDGCCDEVSDSDWAEVIIICPDEEDSDEILLLDKLVKPDCEDELWDTSTSFNYSDYDYVTYRVDVLVNDSFEEPIKSLSVRDNLPQLDGLVYNESYIREIIDDNEIPYEEYTVSVTDDFIYWNFTEDVNPGAMFSIYYCADVIACGEFENEVNVTGFYYDDGPCCPVDIYVNDSAIVDVICGPGIEITKEASLDGETWSDDSVDTYIDDVVWFKVTVENTGFEILEGVNVYDFLPDFLLYKQMINDGGADDVNTDCENETYDLRWFFTELAIGEEVEIIFTTDVVGVGSDENLVTVTSCDGPGDQDSVDVSVDEGVFVEKLVSLDEESWFENVTVTTGDTVFWNITVSYFNTNSNDYLHHLKIWDILPEELSYIDDSAIVRLNDGSSYLMNPDIDDNELFWDLNDEFLSSGDWLSVTFETNIGVEAIGELENYVNVTGKVCDTTYYEIDDIAHIYVPSGMLIDCEKLVRQDSSDVWSDSIEADEDDRVTFRIMITNTYHMPMYDIGVWDDLPSSMDYVAGSAEILFNGSTYDCEPDGTSNNKIIWNNLCYCIPAPEGQVAQYLNPGETVYLQFDADINDVGIMVNYVSINGTICNQGLDAECSDTATVNVDVDPLIADAGTSYSGFVNDVIQLSGSATGGVQPYSYYWDLDDDGEFDDSTDQNPTKIWTQTGSYTISLKVVDDAGKNSTDTATVTIDDREANLFCSGSITLNDIEPGSTQTSTITIENTGDPGSKLDWSILEDELGWGEWTFTPNNGLDLTPEDGEETIEVTIIIPDEKNEEFTETITIVNDNNPSDKCTISVTVTTPYVNPHPFLSLLEQIIDRFPFLDWIVETILS